MPFDSNIPIFSDDSPTPRRITTYSLRVFLCYSSKDKHIVRDLYQKLQVENITAWFSEENLSPGQNWQLEIAKAVRESDVVLACLSTNALNRKGFLHKELKFALDIADEKPEGKIFIIPIKLEECEIPERLNHLHYINLSDEQEFKRLLNALRKLAIEIHLEKQGKTTQHFQSVDSWDYGNKRTEKLQTEEELAQKGTNQQTINVTYQLLQAEVQFEWNKVVQLGRDILKFNPKDQLIISKLAKAYYSIGMDYFNKSNFGMALTNFGWATDFAPHNGYYYYLRGYCYLQIGDFDQAIVSTSRAIQLQPEQLAYYCQRGRIYEAKKDYERALSEYKHVIQANPTNPDYQWVREAYERVGKAYEESQARDKRMRQIGELSSMISYASHYSDWNTVIQLGMRIQKLDMERTASFTPATLAKAYHLRGINFLNANTYGRSADGFDRAIADFTEAIKLDPTVVDNFKQRGLSYYYKGQHDLAIADFTKAIQLLPRNPDNYYYRAINYYHNRNYEQAIEDLTQALQLAPDEAKYFYQRAIVWRHAKDYDHAIADLYRAIEFDQNHPDYYAERGFNYYHKKDYPKAINDINNAIRIHPYNGMYFYWRSLIYQSEKNYQSAMVDINIAIQIDPKNAIYICFRGVLYFLTKDYKSALQDLDQAIILNPNNSNLFYERASFHKARHDRKAALLDLKQAADLGHETAKIELKKGSGFLKLP